MKQHTRWTRLLATPLAALMLVLAGCETTQLDEPTAAPVESRKPVAGTAGAAGGTPGAAAAGTPQSQVASVDLERAAAARAAAQAAAAATSQRIDERGSREYNLALGQKRAEAVVRSLALLGAGEQQLEAVSFGEERPAVPGSDEEAWSRNRRAELKDR